MLRYLVVRPVISCNATCPVTGQPVKVIVAEQVDTLEVAESCDGCNSGKVQTQAHAPAVGANGVILGKLAGLLQKAIANAPQLISEITAILALFGETAPAPVAAPDNTANS